MFEVGVVTLVPDLWEHLLGGATGLVGRGFEEGVANASIVSLRDFGRGVHRSVDDTPYGGGPGMVLSVEPLHAAVQAVRKRCDGPVVLLDPKGEPFTQSDAKRWSQGKGLGLVCGRYEGFDERIVEDVDEVVSVGDFVLSAGDPAAWCVVDSVVRLLPGVLGNPRSLDRESCDTSGPEYPQYTRPATFQGRSVPEVLMGGNHAQIDAFREASAQSLREKRQMMLVSRHSR